MTTIDAPACCPCAGVRAALRALLWMVLATLVVAGGFAAFALQALKPQPGEWSRRVQLGPIERELSVPQMIRIATHPLGLASLDGHELVTSAGRWRFERRAPDTLVAVCEPCTVKLAALGSAPLVLPRAQLQLTRTEVDRYRGELRLGAATGTDAALVIAWKAKLAASGLTIDAELPPQALADAFGAVGSRELPELARARIDGRIQGRLKWTLPGGAIRPAIQVTGFEVAGLGTEALLDAALPAGCARDAALAGASATRVVGWLPRAVVAAEDQRYFEHPGYDLAQMLAAWSANQTVADGGPGLQGASTLTQQLAKRLYVGDERRPARKLRELLYAVEMERTLGKARILQLYLQLAPWGESVCGAEAAARGYLRKASERLTPIEAAWLATLLRDGGRAHAEGRIDRERVAFVLGGMRGPLSAERRAEQIELALTWEPAVRR